MIRWSDVLSYRAFGCGAYWLSLYEIYASEQILQHQLSMNMCMHVHIIIAANISESLFKPHATPQSVAMLPGVRVLSDMP